MQANFQKMAARYFPQSLYAMWGIKCIPEASFLQRMDVLWDRDNYYNMKYNGTTVTSPKIVANSLKDHCVIQDNDLAIYMQGRESGSSRFETCLGVIPQVVLLKPTPKDIKVNKLRTVASAIGWKLQEAYSEPGVMLFLVFFKACFFKRASVDKIF
jgi:hypothetical protein